MLGLVMVSRAPQTRLILGGLDVPSPQNVKDIRVLTITETNVPDDTFLPCQFENSDYTVSNGKLTLIGEILTVSDKNGFEFGHAADTSGTDFIPIVGASVFSQGDTEVSVLELLIPIKSGRVIGCLAVLPNKSIALTVYSIEIFDETLENQPTVLLP